MKVREMFNKVAKFNMMAEELGIEERKSIRFYDNHCSLVTGTFNSYADFMKMVKREYIGEAVKEFQTREDFNLNKDTTYTYILDEGTPYEWKFENSYRFDVVEYNY